MPPNRQYLKLRLAAPTTSPHTTCPMTSSGLSENNGFTGKVLPGRINPKIEKPADNTQYNMDAFMMNRGCNFIFYHKRCK